MQAIQKFENSTKVEVRYLAIQTWWQLRTAVDDAAFKEFDQWLALWYYRYWQWRASMQMVSHSFTEYIVSWTY